MFSLRLPTPWLRPLGPLGLILLLGLGGCDKPAEGEAGSDANSKPGAATPGSDGAPAASSAKLFEKDQRKKGCEMLTAATVAKLLEVPEAELTQMKIDGCIYSWESADKSQIAEAAVMAISVAEDAAEARKRFDNATRSQTAAEIREQLAGVVDQAKEQDAIDTKTKEKTVEQVGGMMGAMVPEQGFQFEDVDGIGDAARILVHESAVTVLVGNMTLRVRAYKGPASPPLDTSSAGGNMDELLALAKRSEAAFLEKTRDVRTQQATALAKAILAGL